MSVFWTVVAGVTAFVIGQAVQRFVLEPIQEQRRVIGDIANALLYLGNVGPLPQWLPDAASLVLPENHAQATRNIRLLAARLRATLCTIPFYGWWAALRFIPPAERIRKASQSIVGWSNSLQSGQPDAARQRTAELLRLHMD